MNRNNIQSIMATAGAVMLTSLALHAQPAPPYYAELSPHGQWMDWGGEIQVWQPEVVLHQPAWRPYYDDGIWHWNGAAWEWRSRHSWGRYVFHYGRWWETPAMGWVWVPGTVYAPAWVHWRYSGNVWGWAPMPPEPVLQARLSYGHALFAGTHWSLSFDLGPTHYRFVPATHFVSTRMTSYGLCGSEGYVSFSVTRTVSSGPSPYTVGVTTTTTVRQGYGVGSIHQGYVTDQPYYGHYGYPAQAPVVRSAPAYRHPAPPSQAPQRLTRAREVQRAAPPTPTRVGPSTPTRVGPPTPTRVGPSTPTRVGPGTLTRGSSPPVATTRAPARLSAAQQAAPRSAPAAAAVRSAPRSTSRTPSQSSPPASGRATAALRASQGRR